MSHEYRNQKDKTNNKKIDELLLEMPLFVEDFYYHLTAKGSSTNTIKSYLYEINVFLRFIQGILKISDIKSIEVTDLDRISITHIEIYISKSENGVDLSASAKRRKLSVLRHMYKYYISAESIKTNPTLNVGGPRIKEHDVIRLTDSQVKALLSCVKNQDGVTDRSKIYNRRMALRDLAIVTVLLGTGMRISELVGLNISDFDTTDPDRPCFHIIRKGGDSDTVYFVPQVLEAVSDYLDISRKSLKPADGENALFISITGRRMGVAAVQKMMKKYCSAIDLPDNISPHKLRATFATAVYTDTKDIYAIKDALHHKSIDTSKHYISGRTERLEKASKAAGKLFEASHD